MLICCDSLSKKELWYICNNFHFSNSSENDVVIRFQKRNFDIFATIWSSDGRFGIRCDSLSKKELWYICNNRNSYWLFFSIVVIRFQKRNFDIFATIENMNTQSINQLWFAFKKGTLIYLQQYKWTLKELDMRCDSLSKKELWYICNNTI